MIEFSAVTMRGGDGPLLEDFSWQMPDPGIYLLMGGNGTGKSLLSRLLSGRSRPERGQINIMGESAARAGGQVWLADAAVAIREDESVEEYVEYELSCSGAGGKAVDRCLAMLETQHRGMSDELLSGLPHHELLIVQIAIAAMVEGPLRILDGHLTYLDDRHCRIASQLLREFSSRQESFLLMTTARVAGELPDLKRMWLLARERPLRLEAVDSMEGIATGMQKVSSTAINIYFRDPYLSPRELTSGESFRVLNRLEGGLSVELSGTLDECVAELSARGMDIRRIDLQGA